MNSFVSATSLAHFLWKKHLKPGFNVLDATCGNGHDTLFCAQSALESENGFIWAIDIQETALKNTLKKLKNNLSPSQLKRTCIKKCCHSKILDEFRQEKFDLIVYNLGYLPGADKTLQTQTQTTLKSLGQALGLLNDSGMLSIICYPGHDEGKKESNFVYKWASELDFNYCVTKHLWANRSEKAPFLILIQKITRSA